jgi:hypothetical protein
MKFYLLILSILSCFHSLAQFAPAAGQIGTTAISSSSSLFIDWATDISIERGNINISEPDSGLAYFGENENALGSATLNNSVISLGDGGNAILQFHSPIINGPGYDFAVFENALNDSFLELAFVEVSSDGINYFRFPSVSHTQSEIQIETFGYTYPVKLNNLAGKYRYGFGTPFDLEEMNNIIGLDVMNITHVKIIDVIGSIFDSLATYDSEGNKINNNYPTPFASSGFDLDAVGVINSLYNSISTIDNNNFDLYPNPVSNKIYSTLFKEGIEVKIYDINGKLIFDLPKINENYISVDLNDGIYFIELLDDQNIYTDKLIVKN